MCLKVAGVESVLAKEECESGSESSILFVSPSFFRQSPVPLDGWLSSM